MIDYKFYTDTYHGCSVSADEWLQLEARAQDQLKRYKRIYTVTAQEQDAEAMAICAMADALAYFAAVQNGTGGVASASIGSVSVSYGNAAAAVDMTPKGQDRELLRCAKMYLDIYRGVR